MLDRGMQGGERSKVERPNIEKVRLGTQWSIYKKARVGVKFDYNDFWDDNIDMNLGF